MQKVSILDKREGAKHCDRGYFCTRLILQLSLQDLIEVSHVQKILHALRNLMVHTTFGGQTLLSVLLLLFFPTFLSSFPLLQYV